MKNDFIYAEMEELCADGVDFVPILVGEDHLIPIICSFTKEQWEEEKSYPKTNRRYWKRTKDGDKKYIK